MPVTYRRATPEDHNQVVELVAELVDEIGLESSAAHVKQGLDADLRAALGSPVVAIFLAVRDGEIIGVSRADILDQDPTFRLSPDRRCGYVDQMYVRPAHRSATVGAALLQRCEAWFLEQGVEFALLHAAVRAVRFYAKAGYVSNREMFKKLR